MCTYTVNRNDDIIVGNQLISKGPTAKNRHLKLYNYRVLRITLFDLNFDPYK